MVVTLVVIAIILRLTHTFLTMSTKLRVAVGGASGETGLNIINALLADPDRFVGPALRGVSVKVRSTNRLVGSDCTGTTRICRESSLYRP